MSVNPSIGRCRDILAGFVFLCLHSPVDLIDDVSVGIVLVMVEHIFICRYTDIRTLVNLIPLIVGIGPVVFILLGIILRREVLGILFIHRVYVCNLVVFASVAVGVD